MTLYGLRHAAATLTVDSGENSKTVQAMLGHATPDLTLGTYAQAVPASQVAAAARFGSLLRASAERSPNGSPNGEAEAIPIIH